MIEYFKFGSGEIPFVILPGLGAKSILSMRAAVEQGFKDFTEKYAVYVLDRRTDYPDPYTVNMMAEDTAQKMTELGLKRAAIFGASQGGMMAQLIAIDRPELVGALVLGSAASRENGHLRRVAGRWAELAGAHRAKELISDINAHLYTEAAIKSNEEFFAKMWQDVTDEDMDKLRVMAEGISGFNAYDGLSKITCPVYVVGAWDDMVVLPEGSLEIAGKLKCELFMYSGYGHAVYDEAPDYRRRILDFIDRTVPQDRFPDDRGPAVQGRC